MQLQQDPTDEHDTMTNASHVECKTRSQRLTQNVKTIASSLVQVFDGSLRSLLRIETYFSDIVMESFSDFVRKKQIIEKLYAVPVAK